MNGARQNSDSPPDSRVRKVISVNTADRGGGAERFAWSIFEALEERGVESWLVVGDKRSGHQRVLPFYLSPFFDYRPYGRAGHQWRIRQKKRLCQMTGVEDFEFPYARHLLELTGSVPDLVYLHNLHGGYFDLRALPRLSRQVPVFVALEDAWLLTGHCAFPMECERWRSGCGECPDLARPPAVQRDATAFNWWCKARILEKSRLYVVSPSQWMLDQAMLSIVRPAMVEATVIPHGIDLRVFHPGDRGLARAGIPWMTRELTPEARVLVTVANAGKDNPFKDWATLRRALEILAGTVGVGAPPVHMVVIGGAEGMERIGPVTVHHVGYLTHEELACHYRAGDLFVHATRAETFGLVTAEAMACGLPVVVSDVGPAREVTGSGRGGVLVPPRDAGALAGAIRGLLSQPERMRQMGEEAARHAQVHFDVAQMVAAHLERFTAVCEAWRREKGDYVGKAQWW